MKAENYNSSLLDDLLQTISPEEQKNTNRRMMLAAKIYDAMKAKGWNQTQFAREMGKKDSEISKWLSGTHSFNADTLWAIGDKLDIDLLPVTKQQQNNIVIKYEPIVVKSDMHDKLPGFIYGELPQNSLPGQSGAFLYRQFATSLISPTIKFQLEHGN